MMAKQKYKKSSWDNGYPEDFGVSKNPKDKSSWDDSPSKDFKFDYDFGIIGSAKPTKADKKQAAKIVDDAVRGNRTDFSDSNIGPNFNLPAPTPMVDTSPAAGGLAAMNAPQQAVPQAPMPQAAPAEPAAPARRGFSDLSPQEKAVASITHQGYKRGGSIKKSKPTRTSASKRGDGCATKGHTRGKYM